ncbi:hypothetical protein HDU83_004282 [Entophlyctis luteolus]|nr:hypothetical protein HDU83_004282 [Entophlyctis luteolus]
MAIDVFSVKFADKFPMPGTPAPSKPPTRPTSPQLSAYSVASWKYRAYVPTSPCSSKIVQLKLENKAHNVHRTKLKLATHTVDITAPREYAHLTDKARKKRVAQGDKKPPAPSLASGLENLTNFCRPRFQNATRKPETSRPYPAPNYIELVFEATILSWFPGTGRSRSKAGLEWST